MDITTTLNRTTCSRQRGRIEGARREHGETLIEFALTLLVCLMTVFGTIEFGLAVWRHNMMSDLAQEGARWASVRGATAGAQKASAAQVKSYVRSRAVGLDVAVTTSADPSSLAPGSTITVSVQNNFAPFNRIVPATTMTLASTAQMVIAR